MGAQHLFPVRWNGRGTEAVCRVVGDGLAFFCFPHRHAIDPIRCPLCGGVWRERGGLGERKLESRRVGESAGYVPLAGARQSRYHGEKHSQQTKTRDDSVMLKETCSCN